MTLAFDDMSDVGATTIIEALRVNKTLTNLHFSGNDISDAGATTIVGAIKVNKTLTDLNLSFNGISDAQCYIYC